MFDPSIGRWLEMDPIAFDAGDANLYRAMGNDPTNVTDSSGMIIVPEKPRGLEDTREDKYAFSAFRRAIHTADESANLRRSIIRNWNGDPNASAFISVYTDCVVLDANDNETDLNNAIELECIVRGSSEANPVKYTHWIQFVSRAFVVESLDTGERRELTDREYRPGDVIRKYGPEGYYVDSASPNSPWYDDEGYHRRTPNEISIFDEPTFTSGHVFLPENSKEVLEVIQFDSYLVNLNKVVYHIHWERIAYPAENGNRIRESYIEISGEPANKLPARATAYGTFLRGYKEDEARTPQVIPSRIK